MALAATPNLPTLYEYYTTGGISSGLNADQSHFTLNDKNITLYSGAMHYFRIPKKYWRDRLRKLRAAGLNTVETYVPWNLHEPENGVFDFGNGTSDYQQFLDIEEYLKIAKEEDLFAIVRPGPYICSEWEWGGFPSWLQRDSGLKVRTSESKYMKYVTRYFNILLSLLAALQFTKGGPVIAFQVENEYAYTPDIDLDYIQQLIDLFKSNGIVELLVSSDGAVSGSRGTLPDLLLQTVNFGSDPESNLDQLKEIQPNRPLMAMEYWTGWFDYWTDEHHTVNNSIFHKIYEGILKYPASVNMYMFHGGTNWGFLSGAGIAAGDNSDFHPITSSYDYDAPISENGDYTDKYFIVKDLIEEYNPVKTLTPELPDWIPRVAYPSISLTKILTYNDLILRAPSLLLSDVPLPMEQLFINRESGQSYGYIVYSKQKLNIPENSVLTITGHLRDSVMILVNGKLLSKPPSTSEDLDGFGFWKLEKSEIVLTSVNLTSATLDIFMENWGRGSGGDMYTQYKGLGSDNTVLLNGEEVTSWIIYPFEFKKWWTTNLEGWRNFDIHDVSTGPGLYKATLTLDHEPEDTYVNMEDWNMGIVIVNGFILGRFVLFGPQQSLYLPGSLLHQGDNEIIVFEQFTPAREIKFSMEPVYITR